MMFRLCLGFPGGPSGERIRLPMQEMQETTGSIPELGRSPGEGNGNPLQYSCLGNPTARGAWWATVHGIEKNQTQLNTAHRFTRVSYNCCNKWPQSGQPKTQKSILSHSCEGQKSELKVSSRMCSLRIFPGLFHLLVAPGTCWFGVAWIPSLPPSLYGLLLCVSKS